MFKSVCARGEGCISIKSFVYSIRTSNVQVTEMLVWAIGIVAGAAGSFVLAHGLVWIDLVAECCGQEAAGDFFCEFWMVAI